MIFLTTFYRSNRKALLTALLIFFITFICFFPTLFNGFLNTWDDTKAVSTNVNLRQLSLDTVIWAFTNVTYADWIPLVWISFAVDYALWGLNPLGYHLTNNIIHSLNTCIFFMFSVSILKQHLSLRNGFPLLQSDRTLFCAILATLLFALHPLRVESVAWVIERKDVLSSFFGISALWAYTAHVNNIALTPETNRYYRSGFYWITLVMFLLSLCSKTMLVTLPVVLLILDWYPFRRITRSNLYFIVLEKIPFLLLSAAISVIITTAHKTSSFAYSESGLIPRIFIAAKAIINYLFFIVWPLNLSHYHLYPLDITILSFEYLMPFFLCSAITICCLVVARKHPILLSVWLVYLITLLPVLGFIQVTTTYMADRYTYVPSLALALLAAISITKLIDRFAHSKAIVTMIITAIIILLGTYIGLTIRQISFWKNDLTLWDRAITLKPHSSGRMYFERASGYLEKGDFTNALSDINEAIVIATKKKRVKMEELYFKRSHIYYAAGNIEASTADYNYAMWLKSQNKPTSP